MHKKHRHKQTLTTPYFVLPCALAVVVGASLSHSLAKEDCPCRSQARLEAEGVCKQSPATHRDDTRLIRHLQHRLRARGKSAREVFAVTERDAEAKIIQKLMNASDASYNSMPFDDRSVSPEWVGLCQDKLTSLEKNTLTAALSSLRLPEYRPVLSLSLEQVGSEVRAVNESAHHIIQSMLGDSRYRNILQQCNSYRDERAQEDQKQHRVVFYRTLGFTADQQTRMSRLVEETLRRLNPSPPPGPIERQEEWMQSGTLHEYGQIPVPHLPSKNEEPIEDVGSHASLSEVGEASEFDTISADFRRAFNELLTDDQREFFNKNKSAMLPFGSTVFDSHLDSVISFD
jgi:hypothetical protein